METMNDLTEAQTNFLLDIFFVNKNFTGWKNVARKLLENGECIVAGEKCIWQGGIGNFIKTKTTENSFGCLTYTFDLKYFLSSEFFTYTLTNHLDVLKDDMDKLQRKIIEVSALEQW